MTSCSGPPGFELATLQAWMADVLSGLDHPPLGMAAALSEECGEVSKWLLDHHAYGKAADTQALGDELIDVLVCVLEIATGHGVDIQEAAARKLKVIEQKAPHWRTQLGDALRKARGD